MADHDENQGQGGGKVRGKVVHYDTNRGFGFLAPDSGGADVFLHINDIDIDENQLKPGAQVEFSIEDTDRGSKATNVTVTGEAPGGSAPDRGPRRGDSRSEGRFEGRGDGRADRHHDGRSDRRGRQSRSGGGQMDIGPFTDELTEILLNTSGSLTAAQIVGLRRKITDFAVDQGWVLD